MITDIFKKNYLLELNTDLQKYIKSFLSYNEIRIIYLNQYIPDLKKKNKRFYNKVEKTEKLQLNLKKFHKYELVINEINKYFMNANFYYCSYNSEINNVIYLSEIQKNDNFYDDWRWFLPKKIIEYIERCIIARYFEHLYEDIIILESMYSYTCYTKIKDNLSDIEDIIEQLYRFKPYKKKQINKLIDIFNEEDPNIFISKQYDHN